MITRADLTEAERAVARLEPDGPLLRLHELLSPASRIEPELLRAMRLELVRDADVSAEQALWFSEFVRSRDDTAISLSLPVTRVLRDRLRQRLLDERSLVEAARELMARVHAELSPVLVLEETLAWAEVFDDRAVIVSEADQLVEALQAGRDGLDHWLARAWDGFPDALKESAAGRNLAQVAALRGAVIEPTEVAEVEASRVAHLLPRLPILLSRRGPVLRLGVPRAEATHALEIPDTEPLVVDVEFERDGRQLAERVEVHPDRPGLEVGSGLVVLRCVDGTEYRLEPIVTQRAAESSQAGELFSIELLPARNGACLLLRYGDREAPAHVVIDGGPTRKVAHDLKRRLETVAERPSIELLVVTHTDDDRIRGALSLVGEQEIEIRDVWFNGSPQMETGAAS